MGHLRSGMEVPREASCQVWPCHYSDTATAKASTAATSLWGLALSHPLRGSDLRSKQAGIWVGHEAGWELQAPDTGPWVCFTQHMCGILHITF